MPKNSTSRLNKKKEHHHGILHVRNSLETKFQLIETILNFWILYKNSLYYKAWQEDFTYSLDLVEKIYYKVWQTEIFTIFKLIITKCDKIDYIVWQVLQSVTKFITKCDRYYKVWQVLQSVTIITKWDVTPFMTVIIRSNYDFQSNG